MQNRSGPMTLVVHLAAFATLFSILFFLLHASGLAKSLLMDDLWLYLTRGLQERRVRGRLRYSGATV